MFTTAAALVSRLSESEKIAIRMAATEDRVHYLFFKMHRHEIRANDAEGWVIFQEVKQLVDAAFKADSLNPPFVTWTH